ncbi:hypothetical protein GF312_02870 [Candidatus Poribacteria bacterium]|nr:hypothetical protein [Candidatus Poribacteria bacterium]
MKLVIDQKYPVIYLVIILYVTFSGCGGKENTGVSELKFHTKTPEGLVIKTAEKADDSFIFVSATGDSSDREMALDTAKHEARLKISQLIEFRIGEMLIEAGEKPQIENMDKSVYSEFILKNTRITEQRIRPTGSGYQAKVTMKMCIKDADIALLNWVNSDEELQKKLEKSESFRKIKDNLNGN